MYNVFLVAEGNGVDQLGDDGSGGGYTEETIETGCLACISCVFVL